MRESLSWLQTRVPRVTIIEDELVKLQAEYHTLVNKHLVSRYVFPLWTIKATDRCGYYIGDGYTKKQTQSNCHWNGRIDIKGGYSQNDDVDIVKCDSTAYECSHMDESYGRHGCYFYVNRNELTCGKPDPTTVEERERIEELEKDIEAKKKEQEAAEFRRNVAITEFRKKLDKKTALQLCFEELEPEEKGLVAATSKADNVSTAVTEVLPSIFHMSKDVNKNKQTLRAALCAKEACKEENIKKVKKEEWNNASGEVQKALAGSCGITYTKRKKTQEEIRGELKRCTETFAAETKSQAMTDPKNVQYVIGSDPVYFDGDVSKLNNAEEFAQKLNKWAKEVNNGMLDIGAIQAEMLVPEPMVELATRKAKDCINIIKQVLSEAEADS